MSLKNFSNMSVNESAMQNVWQDRFSDPCGGRGCCGTNWPTEVVEIAKLCEFDDKGRFLTTFCDSYGSNFQTFLHISL